MARLALEIWILNFNCWYQYHLCLLLLFSFYKLHQYLSIQSFIEYATKIYKILEHCLILFAKWCQKWSPFNVGYGIKVVKVTPPHCDIIIIIIIITIIFIIMASSKIPTIKVLVFIILYSANSDWWLPVGTLDLGKILTLNIRYIENPTQANITHHHIISVGPRWTVNFGGVSTLHLRRWAQLWINISWLDGIACSCLQFLPWKDRTLSGCLTRPRWMWT